MSFLKLSCPTLQDTEHGLHFDEIDDILSLKAQTRYITPAELMRYEQYYHLGQPEPLMIDYLCYLQRMCYRLGF